MKQVHLKLLLSFLLAAVATAQYGAFGNSYGGNYAGLQGLGGLNALQNPAPAASYGQALAAAPAAPSSYSSYQAAPAAPAAPSSYSSYQAAPAAPAAPSSYSSYQAAPAAPAISKSTSSYGAQADATASTGYATTSYNAPASYASSSSNTASSYGSSYSKPSGSYGKSSGYNKPSGYGSSYGEQTGQPYGIQSTGDYANQQYYEEPLDLSRCGPTPSDNPCTAYGPQYFPLAGYPHCYIQCAFERMFVKPCPANLVWNARINVCDWPTVASYGSGYDNYGSGSSSYGSSSSSYGSGSSSYGRKKRFISPVPPLPLGAPFLPFGLPGPVGFPGPLGLGGFGLPGLPGPLGMPTPFIYPVHDDDYSDYDDYDRGSYGKGYKKSYKKYGKKSYGGGYDKGYGESSYSGYDNDYSNKYSKSDYKRNGNFHPHGSYSKSSKYNDYSNDYYRKKRDYGSSSNVPALPAADSSFVVLGQSQIPLANICAGSSKKGNLPHPSDPTKYIACLDEKTQEIMDCPEGLIYISELDRCERAQSAEPLCESRNPCQNEGQCYQTGPSTVKCTCRAAWTGEFCETPVSSCASNPCGTGNTCHTLKASDYKQDFVCVCDQGLSYGLSCDRNTVPNPCRAQSGEIELYHPFAFSANAFVQCDGEILHVQPCAEGLVWSQTQKGCRPIDFQEPQFDSLPGGSYETTLPPAQPPTQGYNTVPLNPPTASAYGSAISLPPAAPAINSYSAPSVTFQTPVIPKSNYGSFQERIVTMKSPSSYSSSFVPSNPFPTPSSYGGSVPATPLVRPTQYGQQTFVPSNPIPVSSYGGSAPATPMVRPAQYGQQTFVPSNPIPVSSYGGSVPATPMVRPTQYGQQTFVPSNPIPVSSYGGSVPATPIQKTVSYGQRSFTHSNPVRMSSYGSAPASPIPQPSSYGQQTFISNPTVSSYGSAPASPIPQPSAYGQQRMIFAPQMFKRVMTRVAQPETSGY